MSKAVMQICISQLDCKKVKAKHRIAWGKNKVSPYVKPLNIVQYRPQLNMMSKT